MASSFRQRMMEKAGDAFSVAERQKYEGLANEGQAPSREEIRRRIGNAWSVSERQFWERMLDKL